MLITRKFGKLLLGKATPAHVFLACLVGSLLGFIPSYSTAPALVLFLFLIACVFNSNFLVMGLMGLLGKAISLAALPLSFQIGRGLLEGPTEGFFRWWVNQPVLALTGFEYYATAGSVLLGAVFGILSGAVLASGLRSFRKNFLALSENTEAFKKWSQKGWVKFLAWALLGAKLNDQLKERLEKARGKIVRPVGIVVALGLTGLAVIVPMFFSGPIVLSVLKDGLERANGATVDIASADVSLAEGRMTIEGLAMADAEKLDTDLLRAEKIEIDVSGADLLRKRLALDRVVLSGAATGEKRAVPGARTRPAPEPPPAPAPQGEADKTLDEWLTAENFQLLQERLKQAGEWLKKLSGEGAREAAEPAAAPESREKYADWLNQQIDALGYTGVQAPHLVENAPSFRVGELIAEKVRTGLLEGQTLDLRAQNLSSHPYLLAEAPRIAVKSEKGDLDLLIDLKHAAKDAKESSVFRISRTGLSADDFTQNLKNKEQPVVRGGTIDASIDGQFRTENGEIWIDLPLKVALKGATVDIPKIGPHPIENLPLSLGLRGPISHPRLTPPSPEEWAAALKAAGADALANKLNGEIDKQKAAAQAKAQEELNKATGKLEEKLNEKVGGKVGEELNKALGDTGKNLLDGILGGKKKTEEKK